MLALNELWYKNEPRVTFHAFNDNDQWLQMDKAGHITTGYYLSLLSKKTFKWTGLEHKKSVLYGSAVSFFFLMSLEIYDGFSDQWGFSWGDTWANFAGISLMAGQEYLWNEQRLQLKFSVHTTKLSQHRPSTLGQTWIERLIKDYNGQTYWLSINPEAFLKTEKIPKWLNIAIGYSGEGMIYGSPTEPYLICSNESCLDFDRYRQYYLSLDIDLNKINTNNKLLNTLCKTIGFIKIPFPALEFSKHGVKGKPFYF